MGPSIDPVTAAVTCEGWGVAQPYYPVLAIECPACGAKPGRKCKRPSGHRIRQSHAARINAAYEAGYTKCPCKTDNAVICAGSTVHADVPFNTDAVTIEETNNEEPLDPDALPTSSLFTRCRGSSSSWSVDAVATVVDKTEYRQHPTDILSLL